MPKAEEYDKIIKEGGAGSGYAKWAEYFMGASLGISVGTLFASMLIGGLMVTSVGILATTLMVGTGAAILGLAALGCMKVSDALGKKAKKEYRVSKKYTGGNAGGNGEPARPKIDPSGYIYEAVPSNRLPGVTVTCYEKVEKQTIYGETYDEIELWDAADFDQVNPLITDAEGRYSWDVPEGWWQVKAEMDGYETTYSEWLPVPPPQLEVNLGMVSYAAPQITDVFAQPGNLDLSFPETPVTVTANFRNYSGEIVDFTHSITEMSGKETVDANAKEKFTVKKDGNTFRIYVNKDAELNVKNSYVLKLTLELAGGKILDETVKPISLKAKRTAVRLKLSTSKVTLNKKVNDGVTVDVSCTTKGYNFQQPVIELKDKTGKNSAEGKLNWAYRNGKLTLSVNEKTEYDTTYKVILRADAYSAETPITVTIPHKDKSDVTVTTKLTGSLDVIRKNTSVTLTPTYKNCGNLAEREESLVFYRVDGRELKEVEGLFTYESNGKGGYTITIAEGAEVDHSQKYQVKLVTCFDNGIETVEPERKPAPISVKMGSAKAGLTVKETILFAKDKYSRGDFGVNLTDATLNDIARVVINDKKYKDCLEVFNYGNGQFAIGFKDGKIPEEIEKQLEKKSSAKISLNLNVFIKGNQAEKANTTAKVTLIIVK